MTETSTFLKSEKLVITVDRSPGMMSIRDLFIKRLSPSYNFVHGIEGERVILSDVSFSLKQGDRVALLGRNGVGKSTFCRSLCGLYPFKGVLEYSHTPLGFLDANIGLFPELSGLENAEIFISLFYQGMNIPKDALKAAIDFSGLGPFIEHPVKYYSPGMLSRLGLSLTSIVSNPIIVMDEVFTGSDYEFQSRISKRMRNLIDQSKILLFVTHDIVLARELCNCALVFQNGSAKYFRDLEAAIELYISQ